VKPDSGGLIAMTFTDGWLLLKKILVGIVITLVPLAIIAGGLWTIQRAQGNPSHTKPDPSAKVTYAN